MSKLLIAEITIPADRFRDGLGGEPGWQLAFEELKASITRHGLLQPIVVSDRELVSGFRRLSACKALGWTDVDARDQGDLTPLEKREIELEENIRRRQFSWLEENKAIVEIDRLKREANPNWGQVQTANLLDIDQAVVSRAQTIVKGVERNPEIGKKAETATQAYKMLQNAAKKVIRRLEVAVAKKDFSGIEDRLLLGDSVEIIKSIASESVHAHITDPPFGIEYDTMSKSQMAYKDTAEMYKRLLTMGPDLYRTLKPDGWLIWFCGISWYEQTRDAFRACGFVVDEVPIIWDRSEGNTFTTNPEQLFSKGYDIAIHAYKGKPSIVKRRSNVFHEPPLAGADRILVAERPIGLYKQLIEALTINGEVVADWFAGSGSCPTAAAMSGRNWIGCEMDPDRRNVALKKVRMYMGDNSVSVSETISR